MSIVRAALADLDVCWIEESSESTVEPRVEGGVAAITFATVVQSLAEQVYVD